MKVEINLIEVGDSLRLVQNTKLETHVLPAEGDIIRIYDTKYKKQRRFRVIERHWSIGNVVGFIEIFVVPTVDEAKTI